jgi:hypothetical protein
MKYTSRPAEEQGSRYPDAPVLASLGLRAAAVADLSASLARLLSPVLDVLTRLWLAESTRPQQRIRNLTGLRP